MRIYSISLLFVVQVGNIKFYQCLELVQITLPVIKITYYQGNYTPSNYIFIVTTPVVRHLVTGGGIRVIPHLFEICWSLILVQQIILSMYIYIFYIFFLFLVELTEKVKWVSTLAVSHPIALVVLGYPLLKCFPQ